MGVDLALLVVGRLYDREELAQLWGYRGPAALWRGVITPADQSVIVLFVTEDKAASQTQYKDKLSGRVLRWEGERGHGTDNRILSAGGNGDDVVLFYRPTARASFTYHGRLVLEGFTTRPNHPSEFRFRLLD